MAKIYSVADARAHLPEILDQVEAGADVGLSRRGRLVAVVLSSEQYERLNGGQTPFADAYKRFADRHDLTEVGLDEDFTNALRDRSPGRRVKL